MWIPIICFLEVKCHNHSLQTNPWYYEKMAQSRDNHYAIEVKQTALSIAKLEMPPRTKLQNKNPIQKIHNKWSSNLTKFSF